MIVLKCIGIFYLVCTVVGLSLMIYSIKHAVEVPQEIDIYDL